MEQLGNTPTENPEISRDLKDFFPSKFARVLGRQAVRLVQEGHATHNPFYSGDDDNEEYSPDDENYSLAVEFRADLDRFNDPEFHKNLEKDRLNQNLIFTHFVRNSGGNGQNILESISPKEKYPRSTDVKTNEFVEHYDEFENTESYFDFVSALTETTEAGNYQISDDKLSQFTGWYLSEVRSLEKTFQENIPEIERYYSGAMKRAINRGYLPDDYKVLVERLDAQPFLRQDIKYSLFDRTFAKENGASPNGTTAKLKDSEAFLISVAIDRFYPHPTQHLGDSKAKAAFYTINHELTHALEELNPMSFNNNGGNPFDKTFSDTADQASRIFKEALTEDIGGIISNVNDDTNPEDVKPFGENGRSYKNERETMRFLQSSGQTEISPHLFYEAYVDSGINWNKLKRALKASFPECKTDSDLAEFIVNKYQEIKEENS